LPKRKRDGQTGQSRRLRKLPDDADAIFRRLTRDIGNLTAADVALVEDTARWAAVARAAYAGLALHKPENERTPNEGLTVPDTTHGDGTEMRKSPLLIVLRTASEQLRANAQQLGATPLARARLPEPETEQLSLADVLFGDAMAVQPVERNE
jgi:phage terminase small subunit